MARKYTAQEMREMASVVLEDVYGNDEGGAAYISTSKFDENTIAEMLRQAADMKEREEKRERKYEYAVKICFKSEEDYALDHHDSLEMAKEMAELPTGNRKIFRREVGEWEEMHDE